MATVNGKDVVLNLSDDGGTTYNIIVCETENGFEGTTEMTTTQTKCDGGVALTAPGATSWTMSGAGVVKVTPDTGEASYVDLLGWWKNTTLLKAKIDDTGAAFKHIGDVYITSLSLSNPVDGNSTFSLTLTGSGALTIS